VEIKQRRYGEEGNGLEVDSTGARRWYKNNQLHRVTSPALCTVRGYKSWWYNNRLHRLKGPAVEDPAQELGRCREAYHLYGRDARKSEFNSKSWRRTVFLERVVKENA
jgi:hypothetical protein